MPRWFPDLQRRLVPLSRGLALAGWAYLVAALAIIVLLIVPSILALFGCRAYVVYGGSMGSALPSGSIGITRKIEPDAIHVGDIVAIKRSVNASPILHRVVQIDTSDSGVRTFITRGDANKDPDPQPVVLQGAGDRIVFSIPWLGYIVHFARSFAGHVFLLFLPATLLTGMVLWQTWKEASPVPYFSEEPQC